MKQRKLILTRILAFIGWIFVLVGLSGLYLGLERPSIPYASTARAIEVTSGGSRTVKWLKAIITLPRKPVLHQSTLLIVSIVSGPQLSYLPLFLTPEPDLTEDVTQSRLAPDHPFNALEVQLSASAFDVDPQEQPLQRYDFDNSNSVHELDFDWTITPKYTGHQTLIITIAEPVSPTQQGEPIERVLDKYVIHLTVSDTQSENTSSIPFFSVGQVTISGLLLILLGSVLNVPWIVELLQKGRDAKEKKQSAPPVSSTGSTNVSTPSVSPTQARKRKKRK